MRDAWLRCASLMGSLIEGADKKKMSIPGWGHHNGKFVIRVLGFRRHTQHDTGTAAAIQMNACIYFYME